jgi:membrane fusion protein, heavy metal efflux system
LVQSARDHNVTANASPAQDCVEAADMAFFMNSSRRNVFAIAIAVAISFAAGAYFAASWNLRTPQKLDLGVAGAQAAPEGAGESAKTEPPMPADSVELAETQLKAIKVETVGERDFPIEKAAVGSIDFNEELLTHLASRNGFG